MTRTHIDRPAKKLAGFAGLLGVLCPCIGLAVLPIWSFPGTGASASEIASFVERNQSALQTVMLLNAAGVSLWMIFGCGVWLRLRHATSGESLLAASFAVGLTGFVTLIMTGFVAFDVLVYRTPDPIGARLLYDLTFGLLAMSGAPTAVALGAFAAVALRDASLPRFTGCVAAIAAIAHVVLLFSFVIARGFLSLEGPVIVVIPALLFAWILSASIDLVAAPRRTQQ